MACGGAALTPDIPAIQTQAAQDVIATITALAPSPWPKSYQDGPTLPPTATTVPTPTATETRAPAETPTPVAYPSNAHAYRAQPHPNAHPSHAHPNQHSAAPTYSN